MDVAACDRLHNTNGGESDTELNELAVKPTSWPSLVRAVTMVTPVANMPKAVRNSELVKSGGRARAPVGVKDMPGNLTDNAQIPEPMGKKAATSRRFKIRACASFSLWFFYLLHIQ